MNELQRVTFDQAYRLDKLGFNWATDETYLHNDWRSRADRVEYAESKYQPSITGALEGQVIMPNLRRPTTALAVKWLRDKHNIIVESINDLAFLPYFYAINGRGLDYFSYRQDIKFATYEECESAALDYVLEYLINETTTSTR